MKVSIIYVSQTGNTEAAAEYIEEGILEKYPFVQVKRMDISEDEVDVEFLQNSDAVIFGSPVYFTSMSWELKRWFDNSFRIDLEGRLGAAFVTAQSPAGGTDTALMEMIRHMLAKGMLVSAGKSGRFQIGAIALAQSIDASQKTLAAFGASIAEKAIQSGGIKGM